MDPRRPVVDPGRLELIRDQAPKLDDALAPLVAAALVHHGLATIVCTELRLALRETCGPEGAEALAFSRTFQAIKTVSASAEQIGGA